MTKVFLGAIAALLLVISFLWWRVDTLTGESAVYEAQRDGYVLALEEQNQAIKTYEQDLIERERVRAKAAKEAAMWKRKWKEDQKDADVKTWADTPHPPVIADRLRELSDTGSSREAGQDASSTRNPNP